jgi:hypothetical protein
MSKHLGFDPDSWVPNDRTNFPVHEIAARLQCSPQHIWNLIAEKEILVPQENIDRAKTRTTVQVPRESLVDFLKQRSGPEFLAKRAQSRTQARK